jgi:Uma2 family endonuclease
MPVVSTIKLTARQFLTLEDPPGTRLELVNGRIAVSPSARPEHSWVDRLLTHILLDHILKHDLGGLIGDVDTVFGKHDVRRPDLIYYAKERLHLLKRGDALRSAPDLCIEIISPRSRKIDRRDKFLQYAKGGIPFYWIVDPIQQTIEGFRLVEGAYEQAGSARDSDVISLPPFEDLRLPLAQLWMP